MAGCSGRGGASPDAARVAELERRVAQLESRLAEIPTTTDALQAAGFEELAARLDSRDPTERIAAARAMGDRFAELRVDVMRLTREGSVRQREALAVLLSARATPEMAHELVAALEKSPEVRVRVFLDAALGRATSSVATDALLSELTHPDELVRAAAARALGRSGDPRGTLPLLLLAMNGGAAGGIALEGARAIGDPGVAFIVAGWSTLGPRERQAAIGALVQLRGPLTTQFLRERLQDASPLVALEAARVLGVQGDLFGRELALERLSSQDSMVAAAARMALDAMESAPAGP